MVKTTELKELVKTVSHDVVVGKMTALGLPIRAASAAEVAQSIEECPDEHVAVEEQDKEFYVIHLNNAPKFKWLLVGSESPIFLELRQRHARWATENPSWKGWIAF